MANDMPLKPQGYDAIADVQEPELPATIGILIYNQARYGCAAVVFKQSEGRHNPRRLCSLSTCVSLASISSRCFKARLTSHGVCRVTSCCPGSRST